MRFSIIRNVIAGYLLAMIGLALACFGALYVLDQAISGVEPVAVDTGLIQNLHYAQMVILVIGLGGLLVGLAAMVVAARQAKAMLERLKLATRHLAEAVVDEEIPHTPAGMRDDLDREIEEMMHQIKASQQRYLDASPLTRLPGNIAIEQVLKGKMAQGEKFALCYIDLDDFKAYNDKYGYAKGSELIKLSGEIIHQVKDDLADPLDFVGHIGGDDFVLITSPDLAAEICESIIARFDAIIPEHYHDDDRERGYVECLDRYGVQRRFPLMTISIAVVSDARRPFHSPIEIAQVATEIKDYVKSLPGSNYLIDRRTSTRWGE